MVKLNDALIHFLPHANADIPTGGRKKCIFKFGSVRMPGLEGFEELEWCGRIRPSRREIVIGSPGVNYMPQTNDPSLLVSFFVGVKA
jgi:hypothetical protein